MNEPQYLRQLGAWPVKIIGVTKKEPSSFKGKNYPAKIVVTFEDARGRLIDANYKLPLSENKWDEKRLKALMSVCKTEKMSDLKGKEVIIVVHPTFWEGKTFWNVEGAYDPSYSLADEAKLDAALGGMDDLLGGSKDPMDDIGF